MAVKQINPATAVQAQHPDTLKCKHGINRQWCAVCNPPAGPRAKVIGITQPSGRGSGNLWGDTRPIFTRKQFDVIA